MDADRFCRQRRLPEIGEAGQARLMAAELVVGDSESAEIEVEYLTRAGVRQVTRQPEVAPVCFVHQAAFEFEASRRVAAGAWRALSQLKRELGVTAGTERV